ncbi:helix-turn-helix transcriptional regulator [Pseudomonas sp. MS646]|uniref:DNA-binding protein n=1 Tax=Pseudomonas chlororaphis TaxID=587753 RepID=A0A0G3GDK2_9PSED|nr:helix-turn-helix transcriptional regulator [Pseudomonas sp. P97.38]AKJ97607.1 DNA-binding protein [Pseudomonas chlororaphis]
MYRKDRTEKLKSNIRYLIKSRGETQLSLCNASGLTRTTIYNILEGRVVNVQQSTVRKISDFFGVSYHEIETVDFEAREVIESTISLHGNMNPAAVPVIRESLLLQNLDKRIGELAVSHPLTYYFGSARNLIAVLLESDIAGKNEAGNLLIISKGGVHGAGEKLVCHKLTKKLNIVSEPSFELDGFYVIGAVIEERFNG